MGNFTTANFDTTIYSPKPKLALCKDPLSLVFTTCKPISDQTPLVTYVCKWIALLIHDQNKAIYSLRFLGIGLAKNYLLKSNIPYTSEVRLSK